MIYELVLTASNLELTVILLYFGGEEDMIAPEFTSAYSELLDMAGKNSFFFGKVRAIHCLSKL